MRRKRRRQFDHSKYYADNREDILEQKRFRYQNDPDYREKMKKRTRERRLRKREGVPPADVMIIKDRRGREYYTIGKLAPVINRKIQTIRWYHRKGLFPEPLLFDTRGWRLYNMNQVRMLTDLFNRYDRGLLTTDDLQLEIHDRWRE